MVSALTISSSTYAYLYGSLAIVLEGRPLLITMSIVTPLDLFVTESRTRGNFYKRSPPPPYDISTLWRVRHTAWPGIYVDTWFHLNLATNVGRHCVIGTHKFYYFWLFSSTIHHSGPNCIEIY